MSTYDASGIKSGDTLNLATLISEMQKLPTEVSSSFYDTLTGTTSATASALVSQSIAVEADDLIILVGHLMYSVSDGSSIGGARLYRDSTAIGTTYQLTSAASDSSGNVMAATLVYHDTNQSGTISYSLRYLRAAGSGTFYSAQSYITVFRCKRK